VGLGNVFEQPIVIVMTVYHWIL